MIRKNILLNVFYWTLGVGALSACNDYDPVIVGYEDSQEEEGETVAPPDIDPSWNLELLTNVGQHKAGIFVYKDKLYDKLFTRDLGWNGGDGVFTTLLPDGNVFWSFNDSFYGVVGENRARGGCSFPRNSLMIQTPGEDGKPGTTDENLVWLADYVQTSDPNADRYYQARTHLRHPNGEKTEEEIEKGDIDQQWLYWAGDATVTEDGKLQVLWGGVYNGTESLMQRNGTALATYNLNGTVSPGKPQEGGYMSFAGEVNHSFREGSMDYGSTLWEDEDGHIYLYGTKDYNVFVARTTEPHNLDCEWEYYCLGVDNVFYWKKEPLTDEELKRSSIMYGGALCSLPWVIKDGDTYYMFGQSIYFGHALLVFRSDSPYGPFTDQQTLFVFPETIDKIGNQYYQNLYMINLHPALSREGELVFSTNTDTSNFWDNFNKPGSADYYRPYFFRVYNWKSIYRE